MKYTRAQALSFIEQSEYLRERCRIEARTLLDESDAQDLLDNPQQATADIYDALVAALLGLIIPEAVAAAQQHAVELGLAPVSNEEASGVAEDAIGSLEETEQEFASRLADADDRLRSDGQSEETLLATVTSAAGRTALLAGVLGLLQGAAAGVVALVEQGILDLAQGKTAASDPTTLLRWHATGDGKSCQGDLANSCEPRDGMEKSLADWTALGLPGAGNLICSIYSRSGLPQCRCDLGNASLERTEPGVVDATDAIKAGRERASA